MVGCSAGQGDGGGMGKERGASDCLRCCRFCTNW